MGIQIRDHIMQKNRIVWKQTKAILNLIGVELVEELKGKEL